MPTSLSSLRPLSLSCEISRRSIARDRTPTWGLVRWQFSASIMNWESAGKVFNCSCLSVFQDGEQYMNTSYLENRNWYSRWLRRLGPNSPCSGAKAAGKGKHVSISDRRLQRTWQVRLWRGLWSGKKWNAGLLKDTRLVSASHGRQGSKLIAVIFPHVLFLLVIQLPVYNKFNFLKT